MTANQQYKNSNSKVPFKIWLKDQQSKGILNNDNNDKMLNASGESPTVKPLMSNKTLNTIGIVSAILIIYGIYNISKAVVVEPEVI